MNKKHSDKIIFFDGICILCNRLVDLIIRIDKKDRIKFASLQGETAKKKLDPKLKNLDSIVFIHGNECYVKSNAILSIFKSLGGIWSLMYAFKILPVGLRDWLYDLISSRRYKLFGTRSQCRVPTQKDKQKILE